VLRTHLHLKFRNIPALAEYQIAITLQIQPHFYLFLKKYDMFMKANSKLPTITGNQE
jgi:hypothetical protein